MSAPNIKDSFVQKRQAKLNEVLEHGALIGGHRPFVNFLKGKKTTPRDAISAYCYDCQAWFEDGKAPCIDPLCPLFAWAPFTHPKKPKSSAKDPTKRWNFQPKQSVVVGKETTSTESTRIHQTAGKVK